MPIQIVSSFSYSIAAMWMLGAAAVGVAREPMPIIDAHVHYNEPARVFIDARGVFEKLDQAAVSLAFVSSTPDDGTLALYQANPARIVPVLRPYRSAADRVDWWRQDAVLEYVLSRLENDVYSGIGEFHLWRPEQAETAQMVRLLREAVTRDLFVHVHSDIDLIHALYAVNPAVRILWAHAGMSADPEAIGQLLDRYAQLWTEISLRAGDIAPMGQLAAPWRELFVRHSDRFMIGSDIWTASRWAEYVEIIAEHRSWLDQMPREVAERIAFQNANKLILRGD